MQSSGAPTRLISHNTSIYAIQFHLIAELHVRRRRFPILRASRPSGFRLGGICPFRRHGFSPLLDWRQEGAFFGFWIDTGVGRCSASSEEMRYDGSYCYALNTVHTRMGKRASWVLLLLLLMMLPVLFTFAFQVGSLVLGACLCFSYTYHSSRGVRAQSNRKARKKSESNWSLIVHSVQNTHKL